jgi:hypothetical protein
VWLFYLATRHNKHKKPLSINLTELKTLYPLVVDIYKSLFLKTNNLIVAIARFNTIAIKIGFPLNKNSHQLR